MRSYLVHVNYFLAEEIEYTNEVSEPTKSMKKKRERESDTETLIEKDVKDLRKSTERERKGYLREKSISLL